MVRKDRIIFRKYHNKWKIFTGLYTAHATLCTDFIFMLIPYIVSLESYALRPEPRALYLAPFFIPLVLLSLHILKFKTVRFI
jgi:hypothetical protein